MGIQIEFNPDLALRNFEEYLRGRRKQEECLPMKLKPGMKYPFLKKGQRNYWLDGEIPLLETDGRQKLSRPLASIILLEFRATHIGKEIYTRGKYLVKEVYDTNNPEIHFEGINKIKKQK